MSILAALSVATGPGHLRRCSVSAAALSSADARRFNRTLSQSGPTLAPATLGTLADGADRGRSLSASLAASGRGELPHRRTTSLISLLEAKSRTASVVDATDHACKALLQLDGDVRQRSSSLTFTPAHTPLLSMSSFVAPSPAPMEQQAVPAPEPEPEPKPETSPPTPAPTQGAFRLVILRDTTKSEELALFQITNGDCTWEIERSRQDTYNLARAMTGEGTRWSFELHGVNCLMVPHFRKYVRCLLANKGVHMGWAMWAAELINKKQLWDSEVARHYLAYYYGLHEAVKTFPSLAQAVPNLPAPLKHCPTLEDWRAEWHAKLRAEQAAKELKIFNTRRIVLGEGGPRLVTPSTKPKAGLGAWLTKKIIGEAHMEYPLELHYRGRVHTFSVRWSDVELLQQECVRRDNKKWDERRPWMEEDANEGYLLKREGFGPPCSMRPPTNSYRGLYEEVFDRFNPKLLKWRAGAMRDFLDSFVRHDDAWEYAKEWEWARHVLNMDRYEADMAAKKAEGGEGMVAGA